MNIERNLQDGYKKVAENETLDFYIRKCATGRTWYLYAMVKGTNINITMAGFGTKKSATHAAEVWASWMTH